MRSAPRPTRCRCRSKYNLPSDPTTTPFSTIVTGTQNGAHAADATYRTTVVAVDGMARTILTGEQADTSALDQQPWIVDKVTTFDGKGAAERVYEPFWSATQPSLPVTPSNASSRQRYDAFGRVIQTYGIDGTLTLQNVYHALSSDHWDAADLEAGGAHQGTYASQAKDGHGRTIQVTERVHNGTALEAHNTLTTYLPTGEPLAITRQNGALSVARWLAYDSLGRMVLNVEPDTSTGFVSAPVSPPPATLNAWRYAYDDNGDLVGTSDARGCGANYLYDAGGRIVAEDFSPCLVAQQIYSPPVYSAQNVLTGDGTEAFYQYDGLDSSTSATIDGTIASLTINTSFLLGRLVSVSDRGARTVTAFDGRGRSIAVARLIAGPMGASDTLAERYAPTWSIQTITYDAADRPVMTSTGADVTPTGTGAPPGLLANGASTVTTYYSQRGTVSSVSSSYGPLVTSVTRDADGSVDTIVYGDVAGTTSSFSYDARRRVSTVQTYRGTPALWSENPPAYTPAPVLTGTPTSLQLLLEDGQYTYDVVDNPVEIDDWRTASEWPAGAKPVSRVIAYDDLYRTTSIAYQYAGGSDPWTSPFVAEDGGAAPDPRLALPSPHVSFAHRVESQTFQYDWLGNTTATADDENGFYDRSLGTVSNGTSSAGPYQLKAAAATGGRGGSLTAAYDAAGNMLSLAVTRKGTCLPGTANCTQRFAYDWDEVGRLVSARRWDLATTGSATSLLPTTTASAQLEYAYDASDARVLKTAVDASGNKVYDAYIFASLELRRTTSTGSDYERTTTTEVPYLSAHGVRLARVHYADETLPAANGQPLHVLLEMPDHLGSASIVVDAATSEVVERGTYMAYGQADSDYRPARWGSFREDYRFTGKEEDVEVGLQYFGKRFLSAYLGRWASADPLTVHAGGSDLNAYAYIHGTLLRDTDPIGLQSVCPKNGECSGGSPEPIQETEAQRTWRENNRNVLEEWLDKHPKVEKGVEIFLALAPWVIMGADANNALKGVSNPINIGGEEESAGPPAARTTSNAPVEETTASAPPVAPESGTPAVVPTAAKVGTATDGKDVQLFRAMKANGGAPEVGPTARTLGARPGVDIPVCNGCVAPKTGGISVAPRTPLNLPEHRLPVSLGGTGKDPVWSISSGALGPNLRFVPDADNLTHGTIQPTAVMTLEQYQAALAATIKSWGHL